MSVDEKVIDVAVPYEPHSPGPYEASKGAEDEPERWQVVRKEPPQFVIATIENGAPGDTLETEGATARLFAIAPEMLEFIREVAFPPYEDSDLASLLETLRVRANSLIHRL